MILNGIPACTGIAIGEVFKLDRESVFVHKINNCNVDCEIERFKKAINATKVELESIRNNTIDILMNEDSAVFTSHLLLLKNEEIINNVIRVIEEEETNAEYALEKIRNQYINSLQAVDNEYSKEKALDIKDVTDRVLMNLLGKSYNDLSSLNSEVVIVANQLTPSETSVLNKDYVLGFVTNIGGATSHCAIMARALEIPAVVGTSDIFDNVGSGDMIIVDGVNGKVIINPDNNVLDKYRKLQQKYLNEMKLLEKFKHLKTYSKDKYKIELSSNIGNLKDIDQAIINGAEGIGLFRSEFIFMNRNNFPTEDEQFESYKYILEKMEEKPVVIRTLDIGGDKDLPYLKLPNELNPFLGNRAIRLCLDKDTIFRTQLKALLRASGHGNLKIMFPMIATVGEFRKAKEIYIEEKKELLKKGIKVKEDIELGIMVEIPSVAVLADKFAKEVDFFSIGTNDLIQYTFAADRMNERVSYLYQPFNPSVIRQIKMVVDAANKENKSVSICGEMAADKNAIPILLGLGIDKLSMTSSKILPSRELISNIYINGLTNLIDDILECNKYEEVIEIVSNIT